MPKKTAKPAVGRRPPKSAKPEASVKQPVSSASPPQRGAEDAEAGAEAGRAQARREGCRRAAEARQKAPPAASRKAARYSAGSCRRQDRSTKAAVPKLPPTVAPHPAPDGVETRMTVKKTTPRSDFKTGEYIVYPAHGVGRIVGIETQEVAGIKLDLFVICFIKDKMTLRVPIAEGDRRRHAQARRRADRQAGAGDRARPRPHQAHHVEPPRAGIRGQDQFRRSDLDRRGRPRPLPLREPARAVLQRASALRGRARPHVARDFLGQQASPRPRRSARSSRTSPRARAAAPSPEAPSRARKPR